MTVKRNLSFVMAIVLCLCLMACGGGEMPDTAEPAASTSPMITDAAEGGYLVGYGKVDITPKYEVTLQGNGDDKVRVAQGFASYIYAICVAITDPDGNTALLISVDSCAYSTELCDDIRDEIEKKTGIPRQNIAVSSIHQHSTPTIAGQYAIDARKGTVESALAALEDRAPATMEIASAVTEGMNFVRHYLMNDGTYSGSNFGSLSSGYAGHAYDPDPQVQFLKFRREGDKKDILLTNFQCHPHMGAYNENYYNIHSDWVGVYRDMVQQQLDVLPIYFSGAGGDMNSNSRLDEENHTGGYKKHGELMAQYAIDAEGTYTPVAWGTVKAKEVVFTGQVNHEEDHLLLVASRVKAVWDETKNREAAEALIGDSGIASVYHAGAIVAKSQMGQSLDVSNVSVISFGDVALASMPYEMFSPTGIYIKENSPYKMTVMATQSNGAQGYFPTEFTFSYGSYETQTSRFVCGTAEQLAELYLSLLNELYE